jgi:hypothetical protein
MIFMYYLNWFKMKSKIFFLTVLLAGFFVVNPSAAQEETREMSPFSKISLKIDAKVYVEQDDEQIVRVVAEEETLENLITEVKSRSLIIRFPNSTMFKKWNPGKIEIYITVPDVDELNVSGSGDILVEELNSRILDLLVSGSGNIKIEELKSQTVNATVSGSGNIKIEEGDMIESFKIRTSGSGKVEAGEIEANKVDVQTSGSGSCYVYTNGEIKARIAGSGNVYYTGNPAIDSSVAGSGGVKKR